jgi:hypothetical protein
MSRKSSIPSERAIFATYRLWRKYADPDGLVSAAEFREMDDDEKREALRELGGVQPVAPDAEEADGDDEPGEPGGARALGAADDDEEEEEEHDGTGDRFVELTDDLIDPRSSDPFG